MKFESFARSTTIGAIALILLSVSSTSAPQSYHSWGVCAPLQSTTSAPPPSACDSPCPTNSCGSACNVITYAGGACTGEAPECSFELVQHMKTNVCRQCTCNADPDDPRCIADGTIFRTGDASMWDCFN
jgi:hypothetical protein